MSITDGVRMAMSKAKKKQNDVADLFGFSKQSMSTKFKRGSWFGKDLVKVAEFTGGRLAFVYPDGQVIYLEIDPEEREDEENTSGAEDT